MSGAQIKFSEFVLINMGLNSSLPEVLHTSKSQSGMSGLLSVGGDHSKILLPPSHSANTIISWKYKRKRGVFIVKLRSN